MERPTQRRLRPPKPAVRDARLPRARAGSTSASEADRLRHDRPQAQP